MIKENQAAEYGGRVERMSETQAPKPLHGVSKYALTVNPNQRGYPSCVTQLQEIFLTRDSSELAREQIAQVSRIRSAGCKLSALDGSQYIIILHVRGYPLYS